MKCPSTSDGWVRLFPQQIEERRPAPARKENEGLVGERREVQHLATREAMIVGQRDEERQEREESRNRSVDDALPAHSRESTGLVPS